ncbi:hypothetical protein U1Q18_042715, partial [Sarracenia purpurea var. burkii]
DPRALSNQLGTDQFSERRALSNQLGADQSITLQIGDPCRAASTEVGYPRQPLRSSSRINRLGRPARSTT